MPATAPPRLYRQYFTPEECADLDALPPLSLASEVHLLRILNARLLASAAPARPRRLHAAIGHPGALRRHDIGHPGQRSRASLSRQFSLLVASCQTASTLASLARCEVRSALDATDSLDALDELDPFDLRAE